MEVAGIVIENDASIANMLLMTGCVVADKLKKE
jgi:hypothetical protein